MPLRPLELKQIFDFSIRTYRANFAPMVLLAALLQAPMALAGTVATYHFMDVVTTLQRSLEEDAAGQAFPSPEEMFGEKLDLWLVLGAMVCLAGVIQLVALPLVHVAVCRLAASGMLGEQCSLGEALAFARERYWATQAALALYMLPLLLLSLLTLLPVLGLAASGDSNAVMVAAFSSMGFIWIGAMATFALYFRYFPAISGALQAIEEPPPHVRGAGARGVWYLKRSFGLTARYYWRVVGLMLLLYMAIGFLQRGVSQSVNLIVWLLWLPTHLPAGEGEERMMTILQSSNDPAVLAWTLAIASLFGLLLPALSLCYQTVLYLDLRFRKEGLDLQMLLDRQPKPLAPAIDQAASANLGI